MYARLALAGSAFFGLSILALQLLDRGVNPMTTAISQYARGPYGALMTAAFVASGLSSVALVRALFPIRVSRTACAFLLLASVGGFLSAIFPIDADGTPDTIIGAIHQTAGLTTFISLLIAALLLTRAFGKHSDWRSFQPFSAALTVAMVCSFVFVFAANAVDDLDGTFGLAQRLFVASAIVWQLLLSYQLAAPDAMRAWAAPRSPRVPTETR